MNAYKVIDEKNWDRAVHCAAFRDCAEPMFCVTFELDVTNFLRRVREEKLSFTLATVYAAATCANAVEAFRYRFLDGQVVLYEKIDTSFTWLGEGAELFKVVNVPLEGTMSEFVSRAAQQAKEQKEYFTGRPANDVFLFSALPWIPYTHISHTNAGKRDNAAPLFDWGKYTEPSGKVAMPFSVQAHHSFVDGLHVGKLYDSLQKYLNEF